MMEQVEVEEPEEILVARLIQEYEEQLEQGDIGLERLEELDQLKVYYAYLL